MRNELVLAINQLCAERNIPCEFATQALESAMQSVCRKHLGLLPNQVVQVKIDLDAGALQ